MKQIDAIDKEILQILQSDCRITAKEIASRLGMSKTPVYERIKKLESQGYITKYVALADPRKAGKGLTIYLSVLLDNHSKEGVDEFIRKVNALKEVNECYYLSGNIDFLLKIFIKDMDDYHRFVTEEFSKIKNVSRFYSSFVMETSKYETAFEFEVD